MVLPAPSGPHPIGTVALHLVDRSRPDPVAGPGHYRELVVSVWYPARDVTRYPRAVWLADPLMRGLLELLPQIATAVGVSDDVLRTWIGTLEPGRAVRIQQAYPLAFFDLHPRHQQQRLLEGPCPAFPEVQYLP